MVVEYLGVFPDLGPHRHQSCRRCLPYCISLWTCTIIWRVFWTCGKQQVYDKKRNDRKWTDGPSHDMLYIHKNPADHKGELDRLVTNGPLLVKSIIRDQSKAPCLIFYTDEQMADIRNLCCSGETVIGVDKTFNLCDSHVTATCFISSLLSVRLPGTPWSSYAHCAFTMTVISSHTEISLTTYALSWLTLTQHT